MKVQFPKALEFLFTPSRYKVAYGGRGGAKSWGFARALLLMGMRRPLRILCAREIQRSIMDSVHKLFSDQIAALELGWFYSIQKASIDGMNGTQFLFAGLRSNIDAVRSMEGCDIVWVEEAHSVSQESWDVLIPTIRKDGSEIWVSFNPHLPTDDTYQRFVLHPLADSIVRKIIWSDNPWFPKVLRDEMEHLKVTSYAAYLHVWMGEVMAAPAGALWNQRMIDAARITLREVRWDLLVRIVVAVDPAVSSGEGSAETGICVVALTASGHVIVLDDLSMKGTPREWANVVISAYRNRNADRVVGEVNNGGDLVEMNLRAVAPDVSYRAVRATRGKLLRAEPVAALYEQGRVHHVGVFSDLEYQMCMYAPDSDLPSPDRMDALVWGITELLIDPEQHTIRMVSGGGYQISPI